MYVRAKTLWDDSVDFNALADECFGAAFGDSGPTCQAYMEELSILFDPPYIRGDVAPGDGASEESDPSAWRRGATDRVSTMVQPTTWCGFRA